MDTNKDKNIAYYGGVDRIEYERMNFLREVKKRTKYILIALSVLLPTVVGFIFLIKK